MEPVLWQVEIELPRADAWNVEDALAALGASTALSFADAEDPIWHLRAVLAEPCEQAAVLMAVAAAVDGPPPEVRFVRLAGRDWVAESYRGFPPIEAGRFYIRGSHVKAPPPHGRTVLTVDAATAFGTGEHASTHGCLLAMDALARRFRPIRVLDMGCGTGILGLAAAKTWQGRVLASDIDPEAARVAAYNAKVNRLTFSVRALAANGYDHRKIAQDAPFDLILSNILARPLCRMASGLVRNLAPGGFAVLAGFLGRDVVRVLAAHRVQGLRLWRRIDRGEWSTLILVKTARPTAPE